MRLAGQHTVRLDDGTAWSVDRETDGHGTSLEWRQRYGSAEDRERDRMMVASVLGTFTALLGNTQKRRNEVMRELVNALDEWETLAPGATQSGKDSGK